MAAAKSTKKSATTSKTKVKAKTKVTKTTATKPTPKKSSPKKSSVKSKATVKSKASVKSKTNKTTKNKSVDFITDVLKQAAKAQKVAQTQTKKLAKELSTLEKQQSQWVKKQTTAKGRTWQSIETKISKLKTQITAARTSWVSSENNQNKIVSLIQWVNQLNSSSTPKSYTPATTTSRISPSSSRPTLVQQQPKYAPKNTTTTSKSKPQPTIVDEDDYPENEELELEDDEIGFVFGDEDEEDEMRG